MIRNADPASAELGIEVCRVHKIDGVFLREGWSCLEPLEVHLVRNLHTTGQILRDIFFFTTEFDVVGCGLLGGDWQNSVGCGREP